ncbi:MAG: 1-acyl-sn-glycerol-3-phosphate acyltransferase [Cyanobacteria bacterium J06614_10]
MPLPTRSAHPPLPFIPTAYSPWVMRVVHSVLPVLLRVRVRPWLPAGIHRIEVENVDRLVDLYAQLEVGEARFLMAVRHVEVDDPLTGLYLCSRAVARAARARGIQLQQPVHTHFVYERGMTLWAGKALGWLLSRIGGVPVRRGRRPDWVGLKAARKLMLSGNMPMVIAPEGATNGHSERLGPLEPGVAQLGFWCAEDLQQAGRSEAVFVIPIGIQYFYESAHWSRLAKLLAKLERDSGLGPPQASAPTPDKDCYLRILRLAAHLLVVMETFYARCYHQTFEKGEKEDTGAQILSGEPLTDETLPAFSARLSQLLDRALGVAEQFFGLPSKGTLAERCRRIEEASWQMIYREDVDDLASLSLLERGLADWAAQEASLREFHMRLVESFVAVDGEYLREKPSFERCAEMALLMSDLVARFASGRRPGRPRLGKRWVRMTVQSPISVTARLADYQQSRRAGRAAVAALTEDIRVALEETIR